MSRVVGIIPARWGSSRFPGKPLRGIASKPLVQHVWERCAEARCFDQIIIATDDMRIAEVCFAFGAEISLTSTEHQSGTDRIAEVAKKLRNASLIFNVQGDEPLIDPSLLRRLVRRLKREKEIGIITAAVPISPEASHNEHQVKVVFDLRGDALYFSRSRIPFSRTAQQTRYYKHLGIYGYRRRALLAFVKWKPGLLEQTERLEQLRALENGLKIRVIVSESDSIGVDTPEDAAEVERLILSRSNG
jgi:3-deoxy-manno-octulosonate cytidylyltransferase (CMP-KDO synthetase)